MKSIIAIAALVACSGAWAQVTSLYCDTVEENIGLAPFVMTIDLDAKIADRISMKSEREAKPAPPSAYDVISATPNQIKLSDYKTVPVTAFSYTELTINRASLLAAHMFRNYETREPLDEFALDYFQCKLVETPKAKF